MSREAVVQIATCSKCPDRELKMEKDMRHMICRKTGIVIQTVLFIKAFLEPDPEIPIWCPRASNITYDNMIVGLPVGDITIEKKKGGMGITIQFEGKEVCEVFYDKGRETLFVKRWTNSQGGSLVTATWGTFLNGKLKG